MQLISYLKERKRKRQKEKEEEKEDEKEEEKGKEQEKEKEGKGRGRGKGQKKRTRKQARFARKSNATMVFDLNNEQCALIWCLSMSAVGKAQLSDDDDDDDDDSCISWNSDEPDTSSCSE